MNSVSSPIYNKEPALYIWSRKFHDSGLGRITGYNEMYPSLPEGIAGQRLQPIHERPTLSHLLSSHDILIPTQLKYPMNQSINQSISRTVVFSIQTFSTMHPPRSRDIMSRLEARRPRNRGSISGKGKYISFSTTSRLALGPTQPPKNGYRGLFIPVYSGLCA
jgi:hypothetical protein